MHQELDSLTEPAGTPQVPAARPAKPRAADAKSLVKVIVINIISMILLTGNSG